MRRFHNPRYAPESLERKLSPSSVTPVPVAAEVYAPATATPQHTVVYPNACSETPPGQPGDPVPTNPDIPTGGTDPDVPDGNGSVPTSTPSIPSGPAIPAK